MSGLIEQLINSLRILPGVGPKSAQRMAFHILQRDRANGLVLSKILEQAVNQIQHCKRCNTFCEHELCAICSDPRRNSSQLCIVETPVDLIAIEQSRSYFGLYFVLMGHLSPLDGIGPKEIGVELLMQLLDGNSITEVILATNPTVEGEATAHYLGNLITAKNIKCSRIAHGVPMGGELEYLDCNTLAKALARRVDV